MSSDGPSTMYVRHIVSDYKTGNLVNPNYQREYIWKTAKAANFLNRTKQLGHVLGVITGYTLTGKNTMFLQDGRQRVETLSKASENPEKYGLSTDDIECLLNARVSYQSMQYESHDEARIDFQHLNEGVGLIEYEKYRGDLECDSIGKELYEAVREKVDALSVDLAGVSRSNVASRKQAGQLHRNSLGLFHQFATGDKGTVLYARSPIKIEDQIERLVRRWLDNNINSWSETAQLFIKSIERVNAILREKTRHYEQKRWDMTAVRALYGARCYLKNIGCTSDVFIDLVDWYVSHNINRPSWSSRFEVVVDGIPRKFRMNQVSLNWLADVKNLGGPSISVLKRTKKFIARAGYDESHVTPHADGGGDGRTFSEPSTTNRARGRQAVDL